LLVAGERAIEVPALDLSRPRRVHVVGVAGAGMSAIALVLARMGHRVSGSDIKQSPVLARLEAAGVEIHVGNRAEHVPRDADAVVYSTAVPAANPELAVARELGVPVLHRAEALASIVAIRRSVAVAGSHGKTTTSSMLALALRAAGFDPGFVIGGEVNEVGTNAAAGGGTWLVVEADESDGTFLRLPAEAALVTNVEPDHLDHYGGFDALVAAFERFAADVAHRGGPLVCCDDDPVAASLAQRHGGVTYGESPRAHYRITGYRGGPDGCHATLVVRGEPVGELHLPLGVKAAVNGAGAAAMALELGAPFAVVARALAGFGGVARRFQYRGARDGVAFVDDYAHLPGEVAAAIATAREGDWRRVVVVFQPHRYTRTASIGASFADAFVGADVVVVTDVYPAGEAPIPGVTGRIVADAVRAAHPELDVRYVAGRAELGAVPTELAAPGDVVLTLGAGDLSALPDVWLGAAP
jgi:UDP-N-acetylmuramate--alanine ligase